jgi:hypothetical protein
MRGQLRPDPEYLTLVGTPDVAHFSFTIFVGDNTNRIRKPLFDPFNRKNTAVDILTSFSNKNATAIF